MRKWTENELMTSPYKIYPPPSPEIRNILTSPPPKKIPKFQLPSPLILAKGAHYGHAEFVTTLGFEPKTTKFVGFESCCSHLNFSYCACFEQVPWHSGNYSVDLLHDIKYSQMLNLLYPKECNNQTCKYFRHFAIISDYIKFYCLTAPYILLFPEK